MWGQQGSRTAQATVRIPNGTSAACWWGTGVQREAGKVKVDFLNSDAAVLIRGCRPQTGSRHVRIFFPLIFPLLFLCIQQRSIVEHSGIEDEDGYGGTLFQSPDVSFGGLSPRSRLGLARRLPDLSGTAAAPTALRGATIFGRVKKENGHVRRIRAFPAVSHGDGPSIASGG